MTADTYVKIAHQEFRLKSETMNHEAEVKYKWGKNTN